MALPEREGMDFDVVIVGAGPAGLATAIRLFLLAEAQHHAGAPAPTRDDP